MPAEVRVTPVRWVEDDWPGWIEVELTDAVGRVHHIVDKVPVLTKLDLVRSATLPCELWIAAALEMWQGATVTVTLAHNVVSAEGLGRFTVVDADVRQAST